VSSSAALELADKVGNVRQRVRKPNISGHVIPLEQIPDHLGLAGALDQMAKFTVEEPAELEVPTVDESWGRLFAKGELVQHQWEVDATSCGEFVRSS
jgi:hypothetical protein